MKPIRSQTAGKVYSVVVVECDTKNPNSLDQGVKSRMRPANANKMGTQGKRQKRV